MDMYKERDQHLYALGLADNNLQEMQRMANQKLQEKEWDYRMLQQKSYLIQCCSIPQVSLPVIMGGVICGQSM